MSCARCWVFLSARVLRDCGVYGVVLSREVFRDDDVSREFSVDDLEWTFLSIKVDNAAKKKGFIGQFWAFFVCVI